jgi:release factor glutamine methyltransferase
MMMAADSVRLALDTTAARFAAAGLAEPRADAEVLIAQVLETDRTGLIVRAGRPVPAACARRLEGLVRRRLAREPVFQLVGRREFWSLDVAVDSRVLCPRPESELLVETVVALAPEVRRILDCGTGSGALAAALARELPQAAIVASDHSADALAVAMTNLTRLAPGVRLVRAAWLSAFRPESFDVVVANPPYVESAVLDALAPEVRDFEPRAALDGGPDGLAAIRELLATGRRVLRAGGYLVMELGAGQGAAARALAARGSWAAAELRSDAAGIERVLVVRRGSEESKDG